VQCAKYFAANFVGYALHCLVLVLSLATYASFAVPSRYSLAQIAVGVVYHSGKTPFHPLLLNACALTATAVVTVWNYVVNRNWSFKH
jgi:hypothetical protein